MSTEPSSIPPLAGKALLTGASGFIGGRLRDALLERGLEVVAIRRKGSPPSKKGRSVECDYDDLDGLTRVIEAEKPSYVLHVAGATKGVTYDDFRSANLMPTENLLRAIEKAHPALERFVHLSSLTSYGPSAKDRPLREDDPRRPIEFYGQSKLEAEHAVESRGDKLAWTILRPGGVYGPGDVDYFNLFREVEGRRNVFFGNRDRWFSAIYVDDCVDAILLACTHPGAAGQGFFVDDGLPITWGQFQEAIVEASGKRVFTLSLPEVLVDVAAVGGELVTRLDGKPRLFNRQKAKMGAQEAWTSTSDKLRTRLGWTSKVDYREGVRRAYAWYRQHRWL
ncbi:MAG: NAD(P)-dependent oxidoreductase [Sandaracinaceae bacterium]|nr:NAD(P)-dependent oxidoreductase [Sandaracinaceae bacterium]